VQQKGYELIRNIHKNQSQRLPAQALTRKKHSVIYIAICNLEKTVKKTKK